MSEPVPDRSSLMIVFGGRVWNSDGDQHYPEIRDVIVERGRIASVSEPGMNTKEKQALIADADRNFAVAIDARGKLVMPGFVNAHYHSYDTLSKGLLEDAPFDVWALYSQPAYFGSRSKRELRARTLLGAIDCIRNGITTVQDMCSLVPQDEETLDVIAEAYREIGLRVVFSIAMRDLAELDIAPFLSSGLPADVRRLVTGLPRDPLEDLAFVEQQLSRIGYGNPTWHWGLSLSGPQRSSRKLLEGTADLAARRDLPFFTHVYETRVQTLKARGLYESDRGSIINHLKNVGLLNHRTTFAHGVWLADEEIDLIASHGGSVALNPISNMKLKNGFAPIARMRSAGINLALGCDNCSCGDCQSMLQVMKLFCLIAAANDPNPTGISAQDAVHAATIGGAAAVGLSGEVGKIEEGFRADLSVFDLSDQAFMPFNSAVRQLVYCETGRGLETVIIEGRVVMSQRRLTTVDEQVFWPELESTTADFRNDFERVRRTNSVAIPYLLEANRRAAAKFADFCKTSTLPPLGDV